MSCSPLKLHRLLNLTGNSVAWPISRSKGMNRIRKYAGAEPAAAVPPAKRNAGSETGWSAMRALRKKRLSTNAVVLVSGLGLVWILALAPTGIAHARTRLPVEMGDPDADEGGNPGPGSDKSGATLGKWSIAIAASPGAVGETSWTAVKISYGYLIGLWLHLRIR